MKKECPIKKGGFFKISSDYLNNLPIKKLPLDKQHNLSEMIDKMLPLKERLIFLKDKQTDEKARLEKEIKKIDDEIDQEVYKLYGITKEEQKIIEESLNEEHH